MTIFLDVILIVIIIVFLWVLTVIIVDFVCDVDAEYAKISCDRPDTHSKRVVRKLLKRNKRTALDEYRIGAIYEHNIGEQNEARKHYANAINILREQTHEQEPEYNFIIDRIEDAIARQTEIDNIVGDLTVDIRDDLYDDFARDAAAIDGLRYIEFEINRLFPVDHTIDRDTNPLLVLDTIRENVSANARKTPQETPRAERIEQKIKWNVDPQNVHDSNVTSNLSELYNKLVKLNDVSGSSMTHINAEKYAIDAITSSPRHSADEKNAALTALQHVMTTNGNISSIRSPNKAVCERDVLSAICGRIKNDDNAKNSDELNIALTDALINCKENGKFVCTTGRVSRILTCIARLDKDPDLGVVNTRESLRNEAYKIAADVRDKKLSNITSELREKYDKNGDDEDVTNLVKLIQDDIRAEITAKMSDQMAEKDLKNVISESISSV